MKQFKRANKETQDKNRQMSKNMCVN